MPRQARQSSKTGIYHIILILLLVILLSPAQAFASNFNDTQNHWAKEDIDSISQEGIMKGTGPNTFNQPGRNGGNIKPNSQGYK
ncbi:S-layer homology domain-containing protein [Desulforamulus putei]|nr:S-layer homology domain-containing protein [Desulforamulus putei]